MRKQPPSRRSAPPAGARGKPSRPQQQRARQPQRSGQPQRPAQRRQQRQPRRKPPARRPARPVRRRLLRLGSTRRRLNVGFAAVATLVLVLGGRLVQLQGLDGTSYAGAVERQRTVTSDLQPERGRILDRDGEVLAESVDARTLVADPSLVQAPVETATALAPVLKVSVATLQDRLQRPGRYSVLVGQAAPDVARKAMNMQLPGIYDVPASQRLHPGASIGANVVGFTDADGHGRGGIERAYDRALTGKPGKLTVMTGRGGEIIPSGVHKDDPAVPGSTVQLTIDQDLQYEAQTALATAVKATGARGGQLTVLDVRTGQVRAMAATPTFDAQNPGATPALLSNPNVSSVFEPGSAEKLVTFAAAVQKKLVNPLTPMLVPGTIQVADRTIHDDWVHSPVKWTATGVLAKSSNVGTLMIAQRLGAQTWLDYAKKFGEGQATGVGLPGESSGILPPRKDWSGSTFGNLPIGQGVAVTSLQLASMYQAIANDGVRIQPSIVAKVTAPGGATTSPAPAKKTRVVSAATSRTVRDMLQMVTQKGGTAPKAAIPGYTVGGKTGTGQKVNPRCNCYEGGGYFSTFAGMAPADAARYVISIMVDSPQTDYLGGDVAAPLFNQVMSYVLKREGVPPTGAAVARLPLFAN